VSGWSAATHEFVVTAIRIDSLARMGVPMHPDTLRYWIAQTDRDIYAETVAALGHDPLRQRPQGVVLVGTDGTRWPCTVKVEETEDDGTVLWRVVRPDDCPLPTRKWRLSVGVLPPHTGLVIEGYAE